MKQHRTIFLASSIVLTFLVIATATYPTWLIRRAAAATPAPAVTTAPVLGAVRDRTKFSAEAIAQDRSVPVLTLQNAPDVPQCHEILDDHGCGWQLQLRGC